MFASYCCHIGYSAPLRRRRWSFGQNRTTCRTAKSAVDRPRLQYYEMCEFSLTVTGLWSFAYLSPNRLQRSHPWPYQNRSLVISRCFSPHRLQMRAVATDVARSMLCLSVCLSVGHDCEFCKTAEPIEILQCKLYSCIQEFGFWFSSFSRVAYTSQNARSRVWKERRIGLTYAVNLQGDIVASENSGFMSFRHRFRRIVTSLRSLTSRDGTHWDRPNHYSFGTKHYYCLLQKLLSCRLIVILLTLCIWLYIRVL